MHMLAFTMDPVTPQETADPARRGASRAAGRVRPRVGNGVARAASVVGWLGLAVAGSALVLIAAVVAAGLAVALTTTMAAGRLGDGTTARWRRRHEPWPAMVEADTG